jgi:hypothetical protein
MECDPTGGLAFNTKGGVGRCCRTIFFRLIFDWSVVGSENL